VAVKSSSVVVFFPWKQTGPMPSNSFTVVVVLNTHPLQSMVVVVVWPAAVMEHPKGSMLVIVLVHTVFRS
jgi:hypothetical protein